MEYKKSLNLPRTSFPMKANLPKREPEFIRKWEDRGVYRRQREAAAGREKYILHDGPPYANGHIHMGTAFNKILKDIIVKSMSLKGFDAPYVPGWDCHGLPIELHVDKTLGKKKREMSSSEFRGECRAYAERFLDIQREEFRRLGVLGDWGSPYLTMNFSYQAAIVRELGRFFEKGSVYRGYKPVHWCMSCRTALAEAEVEYEEKSSPSITVRFPIVKGAEKVLRGIGEGPLYAVIWTTTPWTIPANLAVAAHPGLVYAVVETGGEFYLAAEELAVSLMQSMGKEDFRVAGRVSGKDLEGLVARHPFLDRESPLVLAGHVTVEAGTGLVHTAPGHGQEDYDVGQRSTAWKSTAPSTREDRFLPDVERYRRAEGVRRQPGGGGR